MTRFEKGSRSIAALAACLVSFGALAEPKAEELYFQSCAVCHSEDGTGAMPGIPDLGGADGPLWRPDQDLIRAISQGVERPDLPTPMPPRGGNENLTDAQIGRVLEFMRREFGARVTGE